MMCEEGDKKGEMQRSLTRFICKQPGDVSDGARQANTPPLCTATNFLGNVRGSGGKDNPTATTGFRFPRLSFFYVMMPDD